MNKNLLIRGYESKDLGAITGLSIELGYPTTVEQMASRIGEIFHCDNHWTLVAEFETKVVGYIGMSLNYFWERDGKYLRIQALVVSENHRKSGIGRKLLEASEVLAKQHGAVAIQLNCSNREQRRAAHKFYADNAFKATSTGYVKEV